MGQLPQPFLHHYPAFHASSSTDSIFLTSEQQIPPWTWAYQFHVFLKVSSWKYVCEYIFIYIWLGDQWPLSPSLYTLLSCAYSPPSSRWLPSPSTWAPSNSCICSSYWKLMRTSCQQGNLCSSNYPTPVFSVHLWTNPCQRDWKPSSQPSWEIILPWICKAFFEETF